MNNRRVNYVTIRVLSLTVLLQSFLQSLVEVTAASALQETAGN